MHGKRAQGPLLKVISSQSIAPRKRNIIVKKMPPLVEEADAEDRGGGRGRSTTRSKPASW